MVASVGYQKTTIKWVIKNDSKFGLYDIVAKNVITRFSLYDDDLNEQIVNIKLNECPIIPVKQTTSQEYVIEDEILKNGNYTFTFNISANNKNITTKYMKKLLTSKSNPIRKEEEG